MGAWFTCKEDNFQLNTCSHQLNIKEERHEDHESSFILGQPYFPFASCVLDMGKGKLELNIEDQKISFDLIEAIKHLDDCEDWFFFWGGDEENNFFLKEQDLTKFGKGIA